MIILSKKHARSYIVQSQMLSTPVLHGRDGVRQTIEKLGYVQIDTISVIVRAHHHVLSTRVRNYKPDYLRRVEEDRHVFEYWSHAAAYLPMCDYRYSLVPKLKIREGPGHWRPRNQKWMNYVIDQIRAEGPQKVKDFAKDPSLNEDHPWGGHPVTQGLRQLYMEGQIMISGRQGFQKIYDLTERVLPPEADTSVPTQDEYWRYLIRRDLKANGLMRPRELGHLITIPRKELIRIINELKEEDKIVDILVKGVGPYIAWKERFDSWTFKYASKKLHILSPFDNLVIQRQRLQDLFDFDYTLECYVTPANRKIGYFSLPILNGFDFVGQIDLKADRKKKQLIIKNLVWEDRISPSKRPVDLLEKKLRQFCPLNQCEKLEVGKFL